MVCVDGLAEAIGSGTTIAATLFEVIVLHNVLDGKVTTQ
jgi:hypothetical protein